MGAAPTGIGTGINTGNNIRKRSARDGKEENFLALPRLSGGGWTPVPGTPLSLFCPHSWGCWDPLALPRLVPGSGQGCTGGGAGNQTGEGGGRGEKGPPEPMQRVDIPSGKRGGDRMGGHCRRACLQGGGGRAPGGAAPRWRGGRAQLCTKPPKTHRFSDPAQGRAARQQ